MLEIQNIAKTLDSILLRLDHRAHWILQSVLVTCYPSFLLLFRKFERTRRKNTETSNPPKWENTPFLSRDIENKTLVNLVYWLWKAFETKRKSSGTQTITQLEVKLRCHIETSTPPGRTIVIDALPELVLLEDL